MSTQLFALRDEGTQVTLQVFGKLDVTTFGELKAAVNDIVGQVPTRWNTVIVNLQGLDLIDSSGVSTLVGLYKRVTSNGGRAVIAGTRGQPLQVFRILRMDKVFGLS